MKVLWNVGFYYDIDIENPKKYRRYVATFLKTMCKYTKDIIVLYIDLTPEMLLQGSL